MVVVDCWLLRVAVTMQCTTVALGPDQTSQAAEGDGRQADDKATKETAAGLLLYVRTEL
jgi:hypothetical protein